MHSFYKKNKFHETPITKNAENQNLNEGLPIRPL